VGSEDAFCEGEHRAGKLKPLDVERKFGQQILRFMVALRREPMSPTGLGFA
jgi:hypothetical protein